MAATAILGIDFTSAPSKDKPITAAAGQLHSGELRIEHPVRRLESFKDFEDEISAPGPWVAGIDFPFGQPRRLVCALGWRQPWIAYVRQVEAMGKENFERTVQGYSDEQPKGEKHLKRVTDKCASSVSPMNVVNPPVGKMFFEGAPRILRSGASIVPCAPNGSDRIVVEAYPALAAQALAHKKRYRYKGRESSRTDARRLIVDGLVGDRCRAIYGMILRLEAATRSELVDDPEADLLDAVLCALQAAWSSTQPNYGVPEGCDSLEGWIVDPSQLQHAPVRAPVGATERITMDPSICHGKPCVRGLRYPVEVVLEWLSSGMTCDEVLTDHEDLEEADIRAVLDYAARLCRVKQVQALTLEAPRSGS